MRTEKEKAVAAAAVERFGGEAASLQSGGLLLEGSGIWIVRSGTVRLFSVLGREDGSFGKRSHLFDIDSGSVIFGPGLQRTNLSAKAMILATSLGETELVQLPRSAVYAMAADSGTREWMADQLVCWIAAWHKTFADETAFPLGNAGRLGNPGAAVLSASDTADWWRSDPEWRSLDAFHELALSALQRQRDEEAQVERDRLQLRSDNDGRLLNRAMARLQGVHTVTGLTDSDDTDVQNPLLAAARAVGRYMGIEVRSPLHAPGEGNNPVLVIAEASRFRCREVTLAGHWWRGDNGPLLAFTEQDGRPVALLPRKPGQYDRYDPADGSLVPVTDESADLLKDAAYMFYKPLPSRSLKLMDIIRVGAQRGIWRDIIVLLSLGVMIGLLGLLTPIITGVLFDTIIPEADRSQLIQLAFILTGSAVAVFLFEIARGVAMLRIEGRVDMTIQAAVWDRLLRLPVSFFRDYSSGDLAMRANSINAIRRKLSGIAVSSLFSGLFSTFYLILLFRYDSGIALIALGLAVLSILVSTGFSFVQIRYQRELLKEQGNLTSLMLQILAGIAKFRVAAAESRAFYLWANLFGKQNRIQFKMNKLESYFAVYQTMYPILTSMLLYYSIISFGAERISTGDFIAFFAAFSAFLSGLLAMSSSLLSILSVVTMYERAKPILAALPEEAEGGEHPGELSGGIDLSHVHFRYSADGAWNIRDVSLSIRQGAFVAIVGESGSGKSTLMRLLLGFEKPESGTIRYEGKELGNLDLQAVRRQMGVVLQNADLMAGDLYANIVGSSGLTVEDAWEAAKIAGLEEDIREMPMEMHTVIPDGGGMLSGGQRQRLLIARAVVRKPKILFFDEATSALDNRTQAAVSESLERLQATRIVIAHRLSTIRRADLIVVMHRGQIVQHGTYEELVAQEGQFTEMAQRQSV
ncbi:NHLP bacteriocin export ABC transporter permease/ATPase subunit [Cohnella suwonensis]|uniref:NHLP bacteriocin export ABC transporter permease/ATPase subunit n=1 Tax=Cohnella suwonensis TaxID=696072 RepID=A0ABW0LTR6_9BACL